jgi:hypothetical protein
MNVTMSTLWVCREAGCVEQVAVCRHVVSVSYAQHRAPYTLESVTDG